MSKILNIAVAGLGTVGAGLLKLLAAETTVIQARTGATIRVVGINARDRHRDRGVDLSAYRWFDDPLAMARDESVDVVVELIGGADGIAHQIVETALQHGKHVVTANKALLARHGNQLAALAESKGLTIAYEAAVAGGIPAIKTLREGLAANEITEVYGILNGTCNYILTEMRQTGRAFDDVLADAQALGYAETDPSTDIDGIDAAHKLALLASVAFCHRLDFDGVRIKGIRDVAALDIAYAEELGYRIKLLGIARRLPDGGIEQRVEPCLVPRPAALAAVDGVFNAVVLKGSFVDSVMMVGRGAGAGPTASAVAADLIDLARDIRPPIFGVPVDRLSAAPGAATDSMPGAWYLRLMVLDKPGVLAEVAATLRYHQISMETVMQRARNPGEAVPLIITTHHASAAEMTAALAKIATIASVVERPSSMPITSF